MLFVLAIPLQQLLARKIRAIGYTAVQISGFGPVAPKDVARLLADTGLAVAGTHMAWASFLTDLDAVLVHGASWVVKRGYGRPAALAATEDRGALTRNWLGGVMFELVQDRKGAS